MTSPSDPAAVPLPPGDDTAYFNTPQSSVFAATPNTRGHHKMYASDDGESTPQTTRALPPFTHHHLASVYSNMNTPTPVNILDPQGLETPRGRPQQRGGKYHPGQASALRRGTNLGSSISQHSQSSGPGSGSDEEADNGEMQSMSEPEDFDHVECEDLDKTVAVNFSSQINAPLNMSTPLQRQFPGLHYSVKSRRATPATGLLANTKNCCGEIPVASQKNSATFMNPDILPSVFSEDAMHNLPYLSSATPHKLNAIQGSPAGINPYQLTVENSQLSTRLREKDLKIRFLEDMLSGQTQTNFDDFFDFSPEKKMRSTLPAEDVPLTIKKRRRSPTKEMPTTARKTRTSSRTGSRSSVKASSGLFESIAIPIKLTAQERKEERRRRETQELRQFSAIDLEALKGYLPAVVDEEGVSSITESVPTTTKKLKGMEKSPTKSPAKSPVKSSAKSIIVEEVEHPEITVREEASKPETTTPPTPVSRTRQYRSNSAPPMPAAQDARVEILSPIKDNLLGSSSIATLKARIAQLEEELENTTISLQKAVAAHNGERRARIAAEETWRFLEVERKFGVCCQFAQAAGKTTTEAAATVPLPSSPAESVQSVATTYSERHLRSGRYGTRPASRMDRECPDSRMGGERPSSRMAGERPVSRMDRERGIGHSSSTSKIGHISTAPPPPPLPQTAGKKRAREESANSGIGMRKAPVPRQAEKRVLGGGVGAANVPLGGGVTHNSSGGILKKPALGTGVGAPPIKAPVRAPATGTRSAMGLARGARR